MKRNGAGGSASYEKERRRDNVSYGKNDAKTEHRMYEEDGAGDGAPHEKEQRRDSASYEKERRGRQRIMQKGGAYGNL